MTNEHCLLTRQEVSLRNDLKWRFEHKFKRTGIISQITDMSATVSDAKMKQGR